MIQNVITRGLWVEAPGDEWKIQIATIYLPGDRRATAVANLARTRGAGSAKASVHYYEVVTQGGSEGVWLDYLHGRHDEAWFTSGRSAITRDRLARVVFIVGARDQTYAYAQCAVFLHERPRPLTLISVVMAPVRLVARWLGGADRTSGPEDSDKDAAASQVVFDPQTGEVLHVHHLVAAPGARLPDESGLAADVMKLAEQISGRSARELDRLVVDKQDLAPGRRFKVDRAARRLMFLDDPPIESR